MPVVIAGMHRSGTSMVTRLLNLCGLYLGKEDGFLSATKDNPEGFWENAKLQRMNDEILASFDGGWDIPPLLQVGWEGSPHLTSIIHDAKPVIKEISQKQSVWGWKDPRNSLTLPFWKRLIPNLKTIICVRNPFEVYHSLARIGGASSIFSYNLWLKYNQQLIISTQPEECIITHYDSFFHDPQSELRRLVNFLELGVSDETVNAACQTISASLKHNRGSINDLYMTNAPDELLDLYRELCLRAGSVYKVSLSSKEAAFLQNIAPIEASTMTPFETNIERISHDLKAANREKSRLQREIVKLREEKTLEIAKLQEDISILQRDTDNIFASRSWRLIQIIQKIRLFFIPVGSRRGKIVRAIFKF